MFNHEDYVKRATAMRAEVEAAEDQSWRETVDMRYARFITNNAMVKTAAALQALSQEPHTTDLRKFRDHYGNELLQNANTLQLAGTLLFGVVGVADAIGAEVAMRIHAEAAGEVKS